MTARCTSCSSLLNFRAQRGNKLSYHRCKCGGKYEMVSNANSPESIMVNKKGQMFQVDWKSMTSILIETEIKK